MPELRLLHLEDDPLDAQLVQEHLAEGGLDFEVVHVQDRRSFVEALSTTVFDAILADYSLPSFDGISAMALARASYPHIPFILVSGTLGEDVAVSCVKKGASDYVLKGNLQRLPAALGQALEAAGHRERAELLTERYGALFDHAHAGVALMRGDGSLFEVNPFFCRFLGHAEGTLLGMNAEQITHPEDWPAFAAMLERSRHTTTEAEEKRYVRADGTAVWGHVVLTWIAASSGRPGYALAVILDLSERKALEAQLRESQKLDAIGRLAGGIAHDFNNVLTAINGFAELLSAGRQPGDPVHDDAREIVAAASRAARLTSQLLAFSRRQTLDPRPVDVREVVESMQSMLRALVSEDIDLAIECSQRCSARVDVGQVEQVILNLVVNARDAMPGGGRLRISVESRQMSPSPHRAAMPGGRYVRLAVTDSGTGMEPATRDRAFEPFFTTKEVDQGTGLGLSTCYGIVKQHEGFIYIDSECGSGTTVEIFLPEVVGKTPPVPRKRPRDQQQTGAGESILLVEDDPQLRKLASRMLQRAGYKVQTANDGLDGLQVAAGCPELDMLLTDLVMPGMSGHDLADRLVEERPSLRVLFTTGYDLHDELDGPVILKPFSQRELLTRVREILDGE